MDPESNVSGFTINIIGAGLSGLSLALALHQVSIPCSIYETRSGPLNIGGAIMLSPNALKILDSLHAYERVRHQGYNFEKLEFRTAAAPDVVNEKFEFGGEQKYGYNALRLYRRVLIDELLDMCRNKNIPIHFGVKFARIVEETQDGVVWASVDGTTRQASMLVGADGIHSTVREHLYPNLRATFTGMIGITAAVPTRQIQKPVDYHLPVTITSDAVGAFVMAPQQADGSETLIGRQKRVEDQDRTGWARISADKEALVKFLQQDADQFPEIVRSAAAHIPHDKLNVWPFYIVPKLERWTSQDTQRVVILGDAAHAIPPSAGQGVNQAFEDVYMLSLLLAHARANLSSSASDTQLSDALRFWQEYRQERISKIMELNNQIDLRRVPDRSKNVDMKESTAREHMSVSKEPFELGWLYQPDFKRIVDDWIVNRRIRAFS